MKTRVFGVLLVVALLAPFVGVAQPARASGFDPFELGSSGVWIVPNYTFVLKDPNADQFLPRVWIDHIESGSAVDYLRFQGHGRRNDNSNNWVIKFSCTWDVRADGLVGTSPGKGYNPVGSINGSGDGQMVTFTSEWGGDADCRWAALAASHNWKYRLQINAWEDDGTPVVVNLGHYDPFSDPFVENVYAWKDA